MPHVGELPVRPAPERLDHGLASASHELGRQPLCRATLGVGARPSALEPLERRSCLECSHPAGIIAPAQEASGSSVR